MSMLVNLGSLAQPAEKTYDGTWAVQLTGPDGAAQAATLVLQGGYDGNWQDRPGSRRAAKGLCAGKKIPISVQTSTTLILVLTVWGEVVAPNCPTLTVTVRPRGETQLDGLADLGSRGSGWPSASPSGEPAPPGSAGAVRMTLRR